MFITLAEQRLLIEILEKQNVSFSTQKTFRSKKFYATISIFKQNELVNQICAECLRAIPFSNWNVCGRKCEARKKTQEKFYELTLSGESLAEEIKYFARDVVK